MKTLHILYDGSCGLCCAVRAWLARQPAYVRLVFHAAQSPATAKRFPTLGAAQPAELVVVDDRSGVYRGARAWVMVLWALKEYRGLANSLSSPALMPIARGFIAAVSTNRHRISGLLGL